MVKYSDIHSYPVCLFQKQMASYKFTDKQDDLSDQHIDFHLACM